MYKIDESIGFYRKMSELQERLRRSEEERLQLEEKFAVLMRSCHDEEEERLNNLRERYEAFLEEERKRRERNDRILQTLDRIESRAAMLTAKSERLRLLRRHYEAYMLKIYPGWKYVTKFTDGQCSSQKLDPLHTKLNLTADTANPYGGLRSPLSMFPTDSSRTAARTLHHSYKTVGAVSASRTTVDTTTAARNVDGLPLSGTVLPTGNAADTQQAVPSSVIMIGDHSVPTTQNARPVYTQETLVSSQYSAAGQVESNKMRHLDDYLGRAAEILKLNRADDGQRDKNLSRYFNEINADSLKDTKHLGNSVDFELEQNTSGDLLNVSLSDDGVLQEETIRTLSQKGANNRNVSQTQKVPVNAVNKIDDVQNKQAEFHENVGNKDVLLTKKFEDLHQQSELVRAEQDNWETVKCRVDNAENFETVLDRKDEKEFDNEKHLYPQNYTSVAGGELGIPDKSIYCGEKDLQTEEGNEVSHWKQGYSTMNDEVWNYNKELNGQKRIQGFERSVEDPLESEADARRDNIDESSAEEVVNDDRKMPVSESMCGGEGDKRDEQYDGEEPGNRELTEQTQWDESEQQYYQQYAGQQEGDQYYEYREDQMYQQQYDKENAEGYDQQYMMQQGEQYYQQYEEQVEGQYHQDYVDQEGLQYNQQEGQYEQQLDQYNQQYADWQERQCSQQYMEQQAGQYDQYCEELQLEPGVQHVSEDKPTVQNEECNKESSEDQNDQVSDELDQRQQHAVQRHQQGSVSDGISYENGKYQEELEMHDAKQGSVGEGSRDIGSAGAEWEDTSSEEVGGKTGGSITLSQQPDISSDLTEASPSGNMKQYHQLLGDIADLEQSDSDEMEVQLAALVESQQQSENPSKQPQQTVPSVSVPEQAPVTVAAPAVQHIGGSTTSVPEQAPVTVAAPAVQHIGGSTTSVPEQAPVTVAAPAVQHIGGSTTSTEGHKNVEELACRTDIRTLEVTGHEGNVHGNPEARLSSKPERESVALPKEGDPLKALQPSVPRAGSKKLPGLTKMLESDTESLQLDATVSNEDSDDFDFSSDK